MANPIRDKFDVAFRDFETPGVPSSGARKVHKDEARAIADAIIAQVDLIGGVAVTAQSKAYPTKADATADVGSRPAGSLFIVYSDPDGTKNGIWVKEGGALVPSNLTFSGDATAQLATLAATSADLVERADALETATETLDAEKATVGALAAVAEAVNAAATAEAQEAFEDILGLAGETGPDLVRFSKLNIFHPEIDALWEAAGGGVVTAGYQPVFVNPGALRQVNYALGRWRRGLGFKLYMGQIGDSFTASGYRWLGDVVYGPNSLLGKYGDGGAGWVSFVTGNVRPNTGVYKLTRAIGGVAADLQGADAYWTVQRRNIGNVGPDVSSVTPLQASTDTNGMFTLTSPVDSAPLSSVKLLFDAAAACSIRYRWNGGAWTTVALVTSGGPTALALGSLPGASGWTLDIQNVSGATALYGLFLDSSNSGVNFSGFGVNGADTGDFINNDAALWRQSIGLLPIKHWQVMLGTNDQNVARSPASYIANLDTLITRIAAVTPDADVLLMVPPENFDPTRISTPMAGYEQAVREYCADHPRVAALLFQTACGVPGGDYSSSGAFPLWDSDTVHPDPATGGHVMANFYLRHVFAI